MEVIAGLCQPSAWLFCTYLPLSYGLVQAPIFIKQVETILHPTSSTIISCITMSRHTQDSVIVVIVTISYAGSCTAAFIISNAWGQDEILWHCFSNCNSLFTILRCNNYEVHCISKCLPKKIFFQLLTFNRTLFWDCTLFYFSMNYANYNLVVWYYYCDKLLYY